MGCCFSESAAESAVGLQGLANRALLALRFRLRSLCSRRINCCLVSQGVVWEVVEDVVGDGGGIADVVVVPGVVEGFFALGEGRG